MSLLACGIPILECVYCLGCVRWAWQRCTHTGGHDSETWGLASVEEFEPVPRLCRMILAVYEDDLDNPLWAPPGGYGIDTKFVLLRKTYEETQGRTLPYLIYLDHVHADIVLAIRGFNFSKESEYAMMLDNKLGKKKHDGGYVHNGLLKAATWVMDTECEVLRGLVMDYPNYTLTFAGHSLGSGVAAMLAMLVVQNRERLGDLERKRVRCFAIAAARCMSLNLAVRYADVINSVVLQAWSSNLFLEESILEGDCSEDDFLPRTATPLEDVFKSFFCLPCILFLSCLKDTFVPNKFKYKDPRRLYAPGRIYHIVERKPFRWKRLPPVIRTAVPVEGRFEHIVLSCNATSDHAIIWIEREARKALDLMLEKEKGMEVPRNQKMERQASLVKELNEEHKEALRRAASLAVPDACLPSTYGTFSESPTAIRESLLSRDDIYNESSSTIEESMLPSRKTRQETWDELIEQVFETDESGKMVVRSVKLR